MLAPSAFEHGRLVLHGTHQGPEVDDDRLAAQGREREPAELVEPRQIELRRHGRPGAQLGGDAAVVAPGDLPDEQAEERRDEPDGERLPDQLALPGHDYVKPRR